jgi:hypothetical protein
VLLEGLFAADEVDFLAQHYMSLRTAGAYPGDLLNDPRAAGDPLHKYQRLMQMHRWDDVSLRWLLDPRLAHWLRIILQSEPYAIQTCFYFKPPGARGQALHQDNYFVRARPGTCVAAWLALDDCDEENGCLQLVPGSNEWPILCTIPANTDESFTSITVPLPPGTSPEPMLMHRGDVLFFNGSMVHGSTRNNAKERFRRSLFSHYITASTREVGRWYLPALSMDGDFVDFNISSGTTPCGVWIRREGVLVPDVQRQETVDPDSHE